MKNKLIFFLIAFIACGMVVGNNAEPSAASKQAPLSNQPPETASQTLQIKLGQARAFLSEIQELLKQEEKILAGTRAQKEQSKKSEASLAEHDRAARELLMAVDLTDHDLNHNPRRSNGGLTACEIFARRRDNLREYDRRKRREVYGQLKENAVRILAKLQVNTADARVAQTAWRIVVRAWLIENGLVTVKQYGKVSPYFLKFCSHN